MTPKLSVIVHIDVDGRHARVAVTGHLTATNQQGLHPVIHRAHALAPEVTVDLTAADCPSPHAVTHLRHAFDHTAGSPGVITILTPLTPSPRNHPVRADSSSMGTSPRGPALPPMTGAAQCCGLTAPKNLEDRDEPAVIAPHRPKPSPARPCDDHSRRAARQAHSRTTAPRPHAGQLSQPVPRAAGAPASLERRTRVGGR